MDKILIIRGKNLKFITHYKEKYEKKYENDDFLNFFFEYQRFTCNKC